MSIVRKKTSIYEKKKEETKWKSPKIEKKKRKNKV